MLYVQTARHQVAIAGRVTDAVTGKPVAGAQVRIKEAPDPFVERMVMRGRNVRFDSPALDVVRVVLDDPAADAKARLAAAQKILDNLQTRQTTSLKRPDQTFTREDGSFFFMDLQPGPYRLSVCLPGAGTRYAFDGYLFGLDAAIVSDLNAGQKTQKLEEAFQKGRRNLPNNSVVSVIDAGNEWTISADDSGTMIDLYRIYKDKVDPKLLNVHVEKTMVSLDKVTVSDMSVRPTGFKGRVLGERLFSVDPADPASIVELNSKTLPQSLSDKLKGYFTWKDGDPPVVEDVIADASWKIKIKDEVCLVLLQGTTLNVYEDEVDHPVMAEIRVVGSGEFTFSSAGDKGQFRLVGLEQGDRKLRVSAQGYKTTSVSVTLKQGEIVLKDIRLERQ